jgi:ankyrin repeat protein
VNWASHEGLTALHLACAANNLLCAEILLKHGANPDCRDFMQCTPLHKAMNHANIEMCKALIAAKADINCQQYCGTSPLHQAVSEGLKDLACLLLENGAELDIVESYDITPIFSASQFDQFETLEVLLKHAKLTGIHWCTCPILFHQLVVLLQISCIL